MLMHPVRDIIARRPMAVDSEKALRRYYDVDRYLDQFRDHVASSELGLLLYKAARKLYEESLRFICDQA